MDLNYSVSINPYPSNRELSVLFCGYSQTSPDHKVGPLVNGQYLVHFVLSGKGVFYSMGKEYRIGPGSAFFIYPDELVRYDADPEDPWEYRWVGFRGQQADALLAELDITPVQPVLHGPCGRRPGALLKRIQKVLGQGGPACDLEAGGWFRLLLAELVQHRLTAKEQNPEPASEIKRQIQHAVRWLTLQYAQPVSIERMAQTLGYHRTHLSKMFKLHTGMSPMQFLLQVRMERAKLLLAEPLTVEQVASSVGFADPLYFSKQFKKWVGVSPTEYRQERTPGGST